MIISHLWLEGRRNNADPEEQFAILATNLEKVPLRYRFLFVVSQEASNVDCTEILRAKMAAHVEGLVAEKAARLSVRHFEDPKFMDMMEREGVVGPADGAKPRKVLVPAL